MRGIIRDKKHFIKGLLLLCSFFVLFYCLLTPVMTGENGKRLTGLEYADEIFNELSKGSSYFIPKVREEIKPLLGKNISMTINLKQNSFLPFAKTILEYSGDARTSINSDNLTINGELGKILLRATEDSDMLYHNNGEALSKKYNGIAVFDIAETWWMVLKACASELQKQKCFIEAKVVDAVMTRALEPGNNFYGIMPAKMSEHVLLVVALLLFYVIYTLWYGFGIYHLFEGIGLVMGKTGDKE